MLLRSVRTALVVGTILVIINQGSALAAGRVSIALLWNVPLDYLVPFLVATWGALGTMEAGELMRSNHAGVGRRTSGPPHADQCV